MHPLVVGEIACGDLSDRRQTLQLLSNLPGISKASDDEVLAYIESKSLMGAGSGFINTHLLAAFALAADAIIWTNDRRLDQTAEKNRAGLHA